MEIKLQKWGNSCGIRIPSNILKSLNIEPNDKLDIRQEYDKIVISKVDKGWTIQERVEEYTKVEKEDDFTWDEPIGKEIW